MSRFGKKLIAFLFAVIIYRFQNRVGMAVITFILVDILLGTSAGLKKRTILYILVAIVLFIIGHKVSLYLAGLCYGLLEAFSFTFTGGFIGGVVELEVYLLATLLPMVLLLPKDLKPSLKYLLAAGITCFIIGGLVQGTYNAGWQTIFYI